MKSANAILSTVILVSLLAAGAPPSSAQSVFCPVGQPWPGYAADKIEPGAITGDGQTFHALVNPDAGCDCPLGFGMSTLDMFMAIDEATPLPVTITVSMGVSRAIPDPGGDVPWRPGPPVCETPVRDFTLYIPKLYVGFGIALDCECLEMGHPYFLHYTIHSPLQPPGGLYTTGGGKPEPGRFLTIVDSAWVDMVSAGLLTRGNLVVSGSARCCEVPIPSAAESWGGVKALYR